MKTDPQTPPGGFWNPGACLRWGGLALVLGLPWFIGYGDAAVSIFLNLDNGKIQGESKTKGHEGEIEILSMSFGASNSGSLHIGGSGGAGEANVQDITLYKYIDKSTPELIRRVMTGDHIGEATIAFVESNAKGEQPVLTIQLDDLIVTSHKSGGSGGEDRLIESVNLNFGKYTYQTFSYSSAGTQTDSPSMNWDIVMNTGGTGGGTTNTSPSITSISNQTTPEDTPFTTSFTVGDAETPTGSLSLSRSTTNPLVVPLSGIAFGGSGSSRNVTITPAANASGSATVGITVTDSGGLSSTRSFVVTVSPVNDPPAIQDVVNQVTGQDTPLTITLNVSDIDTAAASVSVTVSSENPALIPAGNITFNGQGAATQMTLTPLAGVTGTSLITLTANDGALDSSPVSFTLSVNPAGGSGPTDIQLLGPGNVAPVIAENSPANTVAGTLTATDPDDGNNVTFSLQDSAGGRFKLVNTNQIAVANGGLLDFESATSHAIIVRATDSGLNTFDKVLSIAVTNVNEAPVIATSAVATFPAGSTAPISGITVTDPDSGASDITLTLQVDAGTLQLDDSGALAGKITGNSSSLVSVTAAVSDIQATLDADGLTYTTTGVTAGVHALSIQANDLGNTGPGGANLSNESLDLTVADSLFNQWRVANFNPEILDNPNLSGPLGDADQNGIANLLEYGVGSNPNNPAEGPGLVEFIQVYVGGTLYPAIRFPRLRQSLDPALEIVAQVATDDFNWRTDPADTADVSTTWLDEKRDTVTLRSTLPASVTRQMMRLRFTLMP